ncbi:MAG: hypothetical protein IMF08_07610, partial [Proteobacteria bacterium]|nr:hypothetical protein [Pseudomonadota bacterium]
MIKSSLDDWPTHYAVPGSSNYSIPRVICPDCGEHASAAFRYPGLDVSKLEEKIVRRLRFYNPFEPHGKMKKGPAEITPDEMRDLSELLAPIMGPGRPFGPFTRLGPAAGLAEGLFDDFCWPGVPPPLFLRQSVFDAMLEAGFPVSGVAPDARYRRPRRDPLIEPETPPTAHVHPSVRIAPCATCGFVTGTPLGGRLDPESWDDGIPFQCVFENPRV